MAPSHHFFWLLCLVDLCLGKIFTAPEQITSRRYDFVVFSMIRSDWSCYVVQPGPFAGCVVASRLSENPNVRVLVIEAGVSDNGTDSAVISTPILAGQGAGTVFDWNYTTTHQVGLNGRAFAYPRGFVMGGSSSLNAMIYQRGPRDDFDRLASVSGDPGWTWDNLQEFIFKNEKHVPAWNNRSDAGEYNPRVHGHGPLLSSLTATPWELDRRVMQTAADHSDEYPFNLDLNSGDGLGVGWIQTSVGNSARSSSSSAYLHPALDSRNNIDLLLHTQVTNLISSGSGSKLTGVQVSQNAHEYEFAATKEVILSAGSVGTPQILMLSGVGPKEELQKFGIKSVVDLPDVGRNLQDQAIVGLQWEAKAETLSGLLNDPAAFSAALAQYAINKTGIAAANSVVNSIAFLRLPDGSPLLKGGDPAAGPHAAHFEFAFLASPLGSKQRVELITGNSPQNTFLANDKQVGPTTGNWVSIAIVVQSPTSRGSINITSSSAFSYPTIDPAFYTTAFDIGTAIHAVKAAQEFFSKPAWDGFIGAPFSDATNLDTDAKIEAYVRKWAMSNKHPTSTARMSKNSDKSGVVGPDLLVKGIRGVRVVDASVLPFAVGGFPQAQVYIIAERAAALIKDAWCLN
ncbi:aryl-alcohol-oxidase from pleurotus Eryingii [Mycena rosella]|uniref:Aryl-alcohol-oxidase from pleurotus Eryingii n=1 Tax=Mycena rosella TaxID=1033263 RepID=A0AAD7DTP6_MYCRO|nr:aryl-alcohol-oxidase from pleurotus Eryingii [Mycena rosella]